MAQDAVVSGSMLAESRDQLGRHQAWIAGLREQVSASTIFGGKGSDFNQEN
jgi:hypothetical protein